LANYQALTNTVYIHNLLHRQSKKEQKLSAAEERSSPHGCTVRLETSAGQSSLESIYSVADTQSGNLAAAAAAAVAMCKCRHSCLPRSCLIEKSSFAKFAYYDFCVSVVCLSACLVLFPPKFWSLDLSNTDFSNERTKEGEFLF
jgi:hypothetical protein